MTIGLCQNIIHQMERLNVGNLPSPDCLIAPKPFYPPLGEKELVRLVEGKKSSQTATEAEWYL